ncbi:YdcF family protein [Paenibacillus sp. YPG26]|uniref:YdcF family protein n=1 Tax=Paenibacillus sp. YPG26 TaxID=2878915 RepID=UPI0020403EA1|nr:YdcF family protein [Paenibacillus sp. YPG26]USB34881.1 YdcF family protein [Paenibacillus sp. YPG26]
MIRSNKPYVLNKIIRGIILAAVLGCLWHGYAWYQIGCLPSTEVHGKADAGIVLGAAMWGDVPSPGLRERLDQSLKEYRAGSFRYFIVSGGLNASRSRYTEAEGMAKYLKDHDVPAQAILLENEATNTYENLFFSREIMKRYQLNTAIIITHTFHGRRAKEMAESLSYIDPQLSLVESKVLKKVPNHFREILAYSKWTLIKLGIPLSI